MRKIFSLAVIFLIISLFFGLNPVSAYDEKSPMVLKCGLSGPENDDESSLVRHIGELVEERTNGRVKFKYFYGSSLIKKPQLVDAVAKGIADISVGPTSFVSGKIPGLAIFEVFGAYRLNEFVPMQKEVDPLIDQLMQQHGIHNILTYHPGPALYPHKSKFLKTAADWKGQKMRMGGKWQATLAKIWGGSPVFMPPGDLYLALQRGTIDGCMLPWHLIYVLNVNEVAPFITATGYSSNLGIITMNLDKWNALTDEDREIFNQISVETRPYAYEMMTSSHAKERDLFISKGVKVYDLTPEEKSAQLNDAYSLWPKLREEAGDLGNKIMDVLEKYRDK